MFAVLACTGLARAAEKAPEYQKLRYEEDYWYLRSPDARGDFFDPIKYIPITSDGAAYLSLGGMLRERYEYQSNPLDGSQDRAGVFLQRYVLHADLHLGAHARAFAQLQSALANGRRGGPSPVDEDELDLHQAFVDVALGIGGTRALTLRTGRQEMAYGSARLIDVRQGPNVRRSFDAARVLLHAGGWQVDGFAARPVLSGGGVFDSRRDPDQALWGAYGSGKPSGLRGTAVDLYYLGFQDDQGDYVQGTASETRHSLGGRLWGEAEGWDYNFESLFQWGHFGSAEIRAWTVASDTGHTWKDAPLQPRLGLRANVASGDDDPNDDVLETFNPLYPRGNYFNELATLGPRNFFDVHPFLTLKPHERLSVTADWDFFWRQSLNDGLYSPAGALIRGAGGSRAHYVGSAVSLTADWQINRHLNLTTIYVHAFPGQFIRDTGPAESIDFIETTLTLTF